MTDKETLLDAILPHVPFDGWSQAALDAALADLGADAAVAKALFARGAVDMALAYHQRGDREMLARLKGEDLSALRYRDRIAAGVWFRLETTDREIMRRSAALFSLPQHAALGAGAVWKTCGLIWEALGDTSQDINWYTKRATLSAVYSATLLFWLGDDSDGSSASWEFLERRISDVMSIETIKGKARKTGLFKAFMRGPGRVLDHINPPAASRNGGPGQPESKHRK